MVAQLAAARWNARGNCLLVVGATYPQELASVRALVGDMPLLVPGVGAQGADVAQAVQAGQTPSGTGLLVSSSRAILYASAGTDFADAARRATQALRGPSTAPATARDGHPRGHRRPRCAAVRRRLAARSLDTRRASVRLVAALLSRGGGPDPDSLDPQKARGFEAQSILRDLCEGLTTLDKHAAVAPGVARSWSVSADGRTYTFKRRPEARWSNGDPVVAADFVAALQRLVDPATASGYAEYVDVITNTADIVAGRKRPPSWRRRPDAATVFILSPRPPYLPTLLSHPSTCPVHRARWRRTRAATRAGRHARQRRLRSRNGCRVRTCWRCAAGSTGTMPRPASMG